MGLSVAMILTGGTAYARAFTETTQTFETGAVDIELRNSADSGEKFIRPADWDDILPGQTLQLNMDVCSKAEPCYVRARYTFDRYEELLADRVFGIPEEWVYNDADGFWYCTVPLEGRSSMRFFDGFTIPYDFPQEENGSFRIKVEAEALQMRNISPDFDAEDPWNGAVIEDNVDVSYAAGDKTDPGRLEIVYEGRTDRLIVSPEDFFSSLPALMPGDSYSRSIELNNDHGSASDLYFYSLADDSLGEKLNLTISTDIGGVQKEVYSGSLNSESLNGKENEICLGTLGAGETGILDFTLEVPESMNNSDILKNGSVKWIFSTDHIAGSNEKGPTSVKTSVNTGDGTAADIWFALMISGCALLIISVCAWKKICGADGL